MSAAAESINVSEKLSKMVVGKQEGLTNGAENLFAPDTEEESFSNGPVNGEQLFEDQKVLFSFLFNS